MTIREDNKGRTIMVENKQHLVRICKPFNLLNIAALRMNTNVVDVHQADDLNARL